MWNLAAHGIDAAAYDLALRADEHERRTRVVVRVHDANGAVVDTLTTAADRQSVLQSGAVTFDVEADVTRSCELTLLDPDRSLMFEADVAEGALWADRFVAVSYGIALADGTWADVPVFYGRLDAYARSGDEITLSALGPEADHLAPALMGSKMHIARRTQIDTAIRRIMSGRGVSRIAMTQVSRRTTRALDLSPTSEPWKVCLKLARDADRQLYFDGAGWLRLRPYPEQTPRFTFDGDVITAGPGLTYDMGELRNVVRVVGKDPEGEQSRPPSATATLQPSDPFHPNRLGPTNYPLRLIEVVQSDAVTSTREAAQMAERILRSRVRQVVSADFSCVPIPHLEPFDVVSVEADDVSVIFPLRTWTLPLDGSEMSVGYTKHVRVRKRTT